VASGFKYTGEFASVLAARGFRDEYTGPWSGNTDIEAPGNGGLYYIAE
jgi:hypothetical protein